MTTDEKQPAVIGSLKRFKVAGFRRLVDVDVELGPLNILIGSNGCGKTSFLDAIEFASRALRRELKPFFNDLGGFQQVLSRATDSLSIEADIHTEDVEIQYGLTCVPAGYAHKIEVEFLKLHDSLNYYRFGAGSAQFSSLANPPRTFNSLVDESPLMEYPDKNLSVLEKLRGVFTYPSIFTGRRSAIRSAQRLSPISYQSVDGDQLCVRLFEIQQGDPELFEMVSDNLKLAFPFFDRLEIRIVADSHAGLYWHESSLAKPFEAGQLSDGILRFLWLLSILYHPDCPPVVLLDEPESHFHPRLIEILIAVFRQCSSWTQIIATTHSPTIVRFIKPEELLVMDNNENGHATIQRASNLNLAHWLEDFTLDKIWSMGRLTEQA